MTDIYEQTDIGLTGYLREVNDNQCSYEVSVGDLYEKVPKDQLRKTFDLLNEKLSG